MVKMGVRGVVTVDAVETVEGEGEGGVSGAVIADTGREKMVRGVVRELLLAARSY